MAQEEVPPKRLTYKERRTGVISHQAGHKKKRPQDRQDRQDGAWSEGGPARGRRGMDGMAARTIGVRATVSSREKQKYSGHRLPKKMTKRQSPTARRPKHASGSSRPSSNSAAYVSQGRTGHTKAEGTAVGGRRYCGRAKGRQVFGKRKKNVSSVPRLLTCGEPLTSSSDDTEREMDGSSGCEESEEEKATTRSQAKQRNQERGHGIGAQKPESQERNKKVSASASLLHRTSASGLDQEPSPFSSLPARRQSPPSKVLPCPHEEL